MVRQYGESFVKEYARAVKNNSLHNLWTEAEILKWYYLSQRIPRLRCLPPKQAVCDYYQEFTPPSQVGCLRAFIRMRMNEQEFANRVTCQGLQASGVNWLVLEEFAPV